MGVAFKNLANFEDSLRKELFDLIAEKAPELSVLANQELAATYRGAFVRDPVDTGASRDNSKAYVKLKARPAPEITVVFEITGPPVDYAIYFLEPLSPKNPNFKYGKRNTLTKARDNLARKLGINTKQ